MNIFIHKNIKYNGKNIIYPLKKVDIWDYNPICLMSSGFMFDEIIINLFSNKAVKNTWNLLIVTLQKQRTIMFYVHKFT